MSDTPRDPPIEPMAYIAGVKVVDIGDLRVARGMTRRPTTICRHVQLYYDHTERRIWCPDCEATVEPFDAFKQLVEQYDSSLKSLKRRADAVEQAEKHSLISLASKALDKVWRKRGMVPACPACGQGLFPEDFKNGIPTRLGREYAEAQRKRRLSRSKESSHG